MAVLLVGILSGAATSLCAIGAQAYLLSVTQPIYGLYMITLNGVIFSVFISQFRLSRTKFATFACGAALLYVFLLLTLYAGIYPTFTKALIWSFLSVAGIAFFRFITGELASRHLNPAVSQSYYPYIITSLEIGTASVLIITRTLAKNLTPDQIILVVALLEYVLVLFVYLQFRPVENLEIRIGHHPIQETELKSPPLQAALKIFALLAFCLGTFKVCEEYLVTVVMRNELHSFAAIETLMSTYYLICSGIVIATSLVMASLIRRRHPSPLTLYLVHSCIQLSMAIYCLARGSLFAFVGFDILTKASDRCLYLPGNRIVGSAFVGKLSRIVASVHQISYYTAPMVLLALLLSSSWGMSIASQVRLMLVIIVAFLTLGIFLIRFFRPHFIKALYELIASDEKSKAVTAVRALSFLRPQDYGAKMIDLLGNDPKKLLRKTIILGLGYLGDRQSLDMIKREFQSDKEEIQIAVLDALSLAGQFDAIRFIVNIVTAREKPKSLRVRMNAASAIAAMYGHHAIPFLLNGLEDEDPRIVANTLEVLSIYGDPRLMTYFEQFSVSPVPRIRANALMGLGLYRSTRGRYRSTLREIFSGDDSAMISSILYVVGKRKDKFFRPELTVLLGSPRALDPVIRRGLAWALSMLNDRRGYDLFAELFSTRFQDDVQEPFMHFFAQLTGQVRFEVIKYVTLKNRSDTEYLSNMMTLLKKSSFDFHEEMEYFSLARRAALAPP